MAEPTSKLTYQELIRKIANKAGLAYTGESGDKSPMVPIDAFNLGFCKDIATDGLRMFISDAPKRGWKWQKRIMSLTFASVRITGTADSTSTTTIVDATLSATYDSDDDLNGMYCYVLTGTGAGSWAVITDYTALTGTITVADWLDQYGNAAGTDPVAGDTFCVTDVETVGGDIARYPLPEYFSGEVAGDIKYAADTNHSVSIEWRDESYIRSRREVSVQSSYPRYAAIRPLEPAITDIEDGSAKRRYELIVDPEPSSADTIEFPFFLSFDNLKLESGLGDSGGNTTLVDAEREEGDDFFNGWICEIIAGTGKGSYAIVTDYTGSTGTFTVADWLTAAGAAGGTNPGANSGYIVYPLNNHLPPGFRFDEAVLSACYAALAIEDEESDQNAVQYYIQKALPKAYEADARLTPTKLGSMNTLNLGKERIERTWNNVTYN